MEDTKEKKDFRIKPDEEVDRRKFIQKSAKNVGGYGLAIYDLAKMIKTEILQGVADDIRDIVEDIKKTAREP
jgi:hypothetical protein